jgi:hypothetical protein
MKKIVFVVIVVIFGIILSNLLNIDIDTGTDLLNTLFTVGSIFFSLGLSIVVTFDLSKVKNQKYLNEIKDKLNTIKKNILQTFCISTVILIISHIKIFNYIRTIPFYCFEFKISTIGFFYSVIIYSLMIYVLNFLSLEKSRQYLDEKIREQLNGAN